MTEHLRRFEVVYADPFGVDCENCYWRTARTAAEAMGTVPGAIHAYEVLAVPGSEECTETREHHGPIPFVPKPDDDYSNPEEWEI